MYIHTVTLLLYANNHLLHIHPTLYHTLSGSDPDTRADPGHAVRGAYCLYGGVVPAH